MTQTHAEFSWTEELIHATTHGAGVILSIAGLSWMLYVAVPTADPWRITASSIYGVSLIALFLASTVYHSLHQSERRHIYKLLDHCAIYLLIAGTYTPFLLVAMRNQTGWWLFGAVWTLATIGILGKLRFQHRYPRISMLSYMIMGWLMVVAAPQLVDALGDGGIKWVVLGGLSYTVGAVFYAARAMSYNHVVWHLFVLLGGACHFLAIIWYVLPLQAVA